MGDRDDIGWLDMEVSKVGSCCISIELKLHMKHLECLKGDFQTDLRTIQCIDYSGRVYLVSEVSTIEFYDRLAKLQHLSWILVGKHWNL